jgi:hypothetical protein
MERRDQGLTPWGRAVFRDSKVKSGFMDRFTPPDQVCIQRSMISDRGRLYRRLSDSCILQHKYY